MRYVVAIGGREREIQVSADDETFVIRIDDETMEVQARRVDERTLSLITPDGVTIRAVVVQAPNSPSSLILIDGVSTQVTLNPGRRFDQRQGAAPGGASNRLLAPMPGKILRVFVDRGALVRPRQPILVVEAMKMENELQASVEGVVTELHVREGESVEAGALLAVITPESRTDQG